MKKTSVAIALYFSSNRDRVPDGYLNDYLFFAKTHLDNLLKFKDKIHKIYFVYTQDESSVDSNYIESYFYEILEKFTNVIVLKRPNLGGSYASWHNVLEFDNNESDFITFIEDDYSLTDCGIDKMLNYYEETPEMIYLCQLWNNERYTKDGMDIAGHAQISNGMINNKLYNKLKNENGLDFTLYFNPGKISIYNNQVSFLEQYRKNNILIRDMKNEYACVYLNGKDSIINFCKKDGEDVFIPISDWFPNHCPNLRYNW